jgi:hypothetical protein
VQCFVDDNPSYTLRRNWAHELMFIGPIGALGSNRGSPRAASTRPKPSAAAGSRCRYCRHLRTASANQRFWQQEYSGTGPGVTRRSSAALRRRCRGTRWTLAAPTPARRPGERFGRLHFLGRQALLGTCRPLIEAPAHNCRRIAAAVHISAPIAVLWKVLTDYNHLAEFIPNLAVSRTCPHPSGGIRLQQEGIQNVFGFRFRAAVLMDMSEVVGNPDEVPQRRSIYFDMVQSRDFSRFEGEWYLEEIRETADDAGSVSPAEEDRAAAEGGDATHPVPSTILGYVVEIVPRHMVPVRLVEWRIREDLVPNLLAVKREAERRYLEAYRSEAMLQAQRESPPSG